MKAKASREEIEAKETEAKIVLFFRSKSGKIWTELGLVTVARTKFSLSGMTNNEVVAYLVKICAVRSSYDHSAKTQEYTTISDASTRSNPWATTSAYPMRYKRGEKTASQVCPRCGGSSTVRGRHARTARGHLLSDCDNQMAEGILKM